MCICIQHVRRRMEWRWHRWIKVQTAVGESEVDEVSTQTSKQALGSRLDVTDACECDAGSGGRGRGRAPAGSRFSAQGMGYKHTCTHRKGEKHEVYLPVKFIKCVFTLWPFLVYVQ